MPSDKKRKREASGEGSKKKKKYERCHPRGASRCDVCPRAATNYARRMKDKEDRDALKNLSKCPFRDFGERAYGSWCGGCDPPCDGRGDVPVEIHGYVRKYVPPPPPPTPTPPAEPTQPPVPKSTVPNVVIASGDPDLPKCVQCKRTVESWYAGAEDASGKVACVCCYMNFTAAFVRSSKATFPGLDAATHKQVYETPGDDLCGGWSDLFSDG